MRRSAVKRGAAVASILQSLETECPEAEATVAVTSQVVKKECEGTSARPHKLRLPGQEVMFELCCDENSTLGQICDVYDIDQFRFDREELRRVKPKADRVSQEPRYFVSRLRPVGSIPYGPWSRCPGLAVTSSGRWRGKDCVSQGRAHERYSGIFLAVTVADIFMNP